MTASFIQYSTSSHRLSLGVLLTRRRRHSRFALAKRPIDSHNTRDSMAHSRHVGARVFANSLTTLWRGGKKKTERALIVVNERIYDNMDQII